MYVQAEVKHKIYVMRPNLHIPHFKEERFGHMVGNVSCHIVILNGTCTNPGCSG